MGSTRSKVDYSDETDGSQSTSQHLESIHQKFKQKQHEIHTKRHRSGKRKCSEKAKSKILQDDILTKPFTYRSRKERLLENFNASEDESQGDSSKEYDSKPAEKNTVEPISMQKVVDDFRANFIKSSSSATNECRSKSKPPQQANRRSSTCKEKAERVEASGVEEKIIKTLIKPRNRKDSEKVKAGYDNKKEGESNRTLSPPQPPSIDFSSDADSGEETEKAKDLSRGLPLHLQELKLRFSNDVPRSPHVDNIHHSNVHKNHKPLKPPFDGECNSNDADFPRLSSGNKDRSQNPKVVRGNENPLKKRVPANHHNKDLEGDACQQVGSKFILDEKSSARNVLGDKNTKIVDSGGDNIKCFQVKTDYDSVRKHRRTQNSPPEKGHGGRQPGFNESKRLRTVRTQTDGCQLRTQAKQDAGIQYDSSIIERNARRILRRLSKDRNAKLEDHRRTESGKKKFRNSCTQWDDNDLQGSSSCSFLQPSEEECERQNCQAKMKSVVKPKLSDRRIECPRNSGRSRGNNFKEEDCCTSFRTKARTRKEEANGMSKMGRELLANKPRNGFDRSSSREETSRQYCRKCSSSFVASEEKLSLEAVCSDSSDRDIDLLSPINSVASFRSNAVLAAHNSGEKDDDIYRQMEDLGLGFVRNGDWIPTDVLTRSVWKNLEKCSENCQATWRRRSRSHTNNRTNR